ncbi:glycosyltransferase family 2 protein [Bacteroides sp.]|uniref:glycosyltransferase family 2 protein n=1 Tax=Bacteroides sp. TaxID=29523 RepID=UPI002634A033|nr:glycosyltransferase family 2 protein [Bacteroides sp.]MDD3037272.1 glycosyltransferase family 2 protein [Bacteroides sp.]
MKISIITVTYNSEKTLRDTILSVFNQTYDDIEYIIIDGASTDSTLSIIAEYGNRISRVVSEPDGGIYDAMNKGISLATGDVVGFLNSDDFFINESVVDQIARHFLSSAIDGVYGDVIFVNAEKKDKLVRYYSSRIFRPSLFRFGLMPAHPTFYVRRHYYEQLGGYSLNYEIASDFDLLVRFLYRYKLRTGYISSPLVVMRTGGVSTESWSARILINKEDVLACRRYGIYTNTLMIMLKYGWKIGELLHGKFLHIVKNKIGIFS